MKHIKLVAGGLAVAVVVGAGLTYRAQTGQADRDAASLKAQTGKKGKETGPAAAMASMLGLTPEQEAKMKVVQGEMQAHLATLKGVPQAERAQKMMAFMTSQRSKMDAILTPEQRQRMSQLMPPMGGPGMGGRSMGAGGFGPPPGFQPGMMPPSFGGGRP